MVQYDPFGTHALFFGDAAVMVMVTVGVGHFSSYRFEQRTPTSSS